MELSMNIRAVSTVIASGALCDINALAIYLSIYLPIYLSIDLS